MIFLGIDVGTLAVKAVLVDEEDAIRAEAEVAIATSTPEPGAFEQDPRDWWAATSAAVDDLRRHDPIGFSAIRGIGLSGQMHATAVLDAADAVIRPATTWGDGRAVAECALLARQVPDVEMIAGSVPRPAFAAARLLWLRENEPQNFNRIAAVLSAKDYVRLRLTGERVTDMSEAAGMLLLAENERSWSSALVAASGIDRAVLPELLEGPAWSGMVLPELRSVWGIDHPVVVAAGAGQIAAAAIGVGTIHDGDGFVAIGAAAQLFVSRGAYRHRTGAPVQTFAHALENRWFETSPLLNGMACLDWLTRIVGEGDVHALLARAQEFYEGPSPLLFLPYFAGERNPFDDPTARGAFAGADATHGQREMTQATMEGIALALREAEDAIGGAFPAGALPLVGEGAKSALWLLILASVLDRPLIRVANADIAAALGAARLGRIAATGETAEAVAVQPPLTEIVDPVEALRTAYAERRRDFVELARSLREVNQARAATVARRRRAKG